MEGQKFVYIASNHCQIDPTKLVKTLSPANTEENRRISALLFPSL